MRPTRKTVAYPSCGEPSCQMPRRPYAGTPFVGGTLFVSWSLHARGVAMVAGAAIVWSTGGLIVRHVDADPWTIVFWRGAFASLTLLLYLAIRDGRNMLA